MENEPTIKCYNCGHVLTENEVAIVEWMGRERCPRCYDKADLRPKEKEADHENTEGDK